MYEIASTLTNYITPDIYKPILIYASWTGMHYVASHVYSNYCTTWSFYGFISTPFIAAHPVCKGLSWFIYESSNSITNMFLFASATLTVYLSKFKVERRD